MINKSGLQRDTYIFKYMTKLSPRTYQLIEKLFPTVEQTGVTRWLLEECRQNLPFQKDTDEYGLERIRFAALKLLEAIELAKRDWRDLLMWACFGYLLSAHEKWAKGILERSK